MGFGIVLISAEDAWGANVPSLSLEDSYCYTPLGVFV